MAKKSFLNSIPAEAFISSATQNKTEVAPATEQIGENSFNGTIPAGYYMNPKYVEAKSKRVQLLMKPSIYEKGKAQATAQGKSFNDYINQLIEKDLQNHE